MALLFVALLMLYLYINPLRTYISTWREAGSKRDDVAAMQREHRQLLARQRALKAPGAVETEARRLGMVRKDERAYVIRGLTHGR